MDPNKCGCRIIESVTMIENEWRVVYKFKREW